jgi:hypothetical protein
MTHRFVRISTYLYPGSKLLPGYIFINISFLEERKAL